MINPENFDCTFRPATHDDRKRLCELASACWLGVYRNHVSAESVRRFRDEEGAGRYVGEFLPFTCVAVIDCEVIGMISQCDGCIAGLYVDARFRGNRVGTSLLHNAWIDGGTILEVSATNTSAINFYERRGWRKMGEFEEDIYGTALNAFTMCQS